MSESRTLRSQLLWSQLRVAALASCALLLVSLAVNLLAIPIANVRSNDVPTVHSAMMAQLGLQRSASALKTWVALKQPESKETLEAAWNDEIEPAINTMLALAETDDHSSLFTQLTRLNAKLRRLKDLQYWIVDVSAKPGNEPARMVYTSEFSPLAATILQLAENDPANFYPRTRELVLNLRIALAELSEALGRFVVDGQQVDSDLAEERTEQLIVAVSALSEEYLESGQQSHDLTENSRNLVALVSSIVTARRSPRSNVAWHTVDTKSQPLALEISNELGALADNGIGKMSNNVAFIVRAVGNLGFGVIAVLFVLAALSIFMARRDASRISAPVSALSRAARSIGRGEYAARLPNSKTSEVQTLIDSFQQMRNAIAESHSSLVQMAHNDELTGLPNRKGFNEAVVALENKRTLAPDTLVAIAHIDFDHFKQVNDSHGHYVGDHILRVFSRRLASCLRQGDVAARLGGDEFAVIVSSLSHADDIHQIVQRILGELEEPIIYDDKRFDSSATIGVFVSGDQSDSGEEMLQRADIALYEAKEKKRGSYCVYTEGTHEKMRRDRDLLSQIKNRAPEDIFELHFQPIVELESLAVVEAETLLRFRPGLGDGLPIQDLILLMERSGQITRVSGWIILEALRTLSSWLASDTKRDLKISINISTITLHDPKFCHMIEDALAVTGVAPERLILEITETMMLTDYSVAFRAMEKLSASGVQFALDDFGTGHSSMMRLKQMPLARLKIDRGFVAEMLSDSNDAAIVEASLKLAHTMGLEVTAEGIETPEQATELRRLRCLYGQGYFFGRPCNRQNFETDHLPQQPVLTISTRDRPSLQARSN